MVGNLDSSNSKLNFTSGADTAIGGNQTATDSELTIDAGANLNVVGNLDSSNSKLNFTSGADTAIGGNQTATDSELTIDAGANLSVVGNLDSGNSKLNFTSIADTGIGGDLTAADSELTIDAGEKLTVVGNLDSGNSKLNFTSIADTAIGGSLTAAGSELTIDAGEKLTVVGNLNSTGSKLNFTSGADTVIGGETHASASVIDMDAKGSVSLENVNLKNGSFTVAAGRDVRFARIEAVENNLNLTAGGDILTTVPDGYIYFRDHANIGADVKLRLTAGGNIGKADHELIVDTNDIVYIPRVHDYFIDSVELAGETLFERRRPDPEPSGSGRDEDGIFRIGALLLSGAATDTVYGKLGTHINAEIAGMVVDRDARENWIDLLDTEALVNLIRNGSITSKNLQQLLKGAGISQKKITQLMKQGDGIKKGQTETGYEQLAKLLIPQLTAQKLDAEGNASGVYRVDDAKLADYLAQSLDSDLVDIDRMAEILSGILTEDELNQMIEDAWNNADYASHEDTRPEDPKPREIQIQVGESTGAAFVKNEGDIIIEQQSGTLTAGAVRSNRGDVSLTAKNGGIEGNGDDQLDVVGENINLKAKLGVGAKTPLRTEQRLNLPTLVGNMTKPTGKDDAIVKPIGADGLPTSEADKANNPRTDWGLETEIVFDWIRVAYPEKAGQINITAGGDVNIIEETGDMGVGEINVNGGDLSLNAPGSILDTRNADQTQNNIITRDGDVELIASNGTIGSEDQRLTTDVDGVITAAAAGDVNIKDTGTLDLIADSENGQVNASAKDDLNLRNTRGDLVIGPIEAGGTATIVSEGSIAEGERYGRDAQVIANSIDLTAKNGDIGAIDNAFDVDTDAENGGTLAAKGNNIYISELDGKLILKRIEAANDASISAPEDILDGKKNAADLADEKQKEANNAKAEANAAEAEAFVRTEEAKRAEEAQQKAEEAVDKAQANTEESLKNALEDAKDALNGLDPETDAAEIADLQKQIQKLEKQVKKAAKESKAREKALEDAKNALAEAIAKNEAAQAAANEANAKAEQKRIEAEAKQAEADAAIDAARKEDPTINVGGDLNLNAGGNIGTKDDSLSMAVGGNITVDAGADLDGDGIADGDGENINISGKGDLNFNDVSVDGHVDIATVDGNINGNGTIASGSLDVSALDGDVGAEDDPLHVSTDHLDALGDNVYIYNDKDTQIGQIGADDKVKLDSDGNVTGDPETKPNIIAGDTTINANGDIGSKDQPLDTSTGGFHGSGDDIYLDNHGKDLEISDVDSNKLHVTTDGNVTGDNNNTHDIFIDADGYVGSPEDPFEFTADGHVKIHGGLGAWFKNLYSAPIKNSICYMATLVLRFDLNIGGVDYSLYALIGFTPDGELRLIGFFLCEGEADEAFWAKVFQTLIDQKVIGLGAVIHDQEIEVEKPLLESYKQSISIDLSKRDEDVSFYDALYEIIECFAEDPETLNAEIEAFQQAIQEEIQNEMLQAEDLEKLLESVYQRAESFTKESEIWIDFQA